MKENIVIFMYFYLKLVYILKIFTIFLWERSRSIQEVKNNGPYFIPFSLSKFICKYAVPLQPSERIIPFKFCWTLKISILLLRQGYEQKILNVVQIFFF